MVDWIMRRALCATGVPRRGVEGPGEPLAKGDVDDEGIEGATVISEGKGRRFMDRKGTLLLKLPSSSSSKALIRCMSSSSSSSSSSWLCRAEYPVPEDDGNGLRRDLCSCCGCVEGVRA